MAVSHSYPVQLTWKADRKGVVSSPDFSSTIDVVTPPQFPKGMAGYWSPEHLLTAAVSGCLMTTFLAVAENSKLEFDSFECDATGKLDQVEGKYMMTEVILLPKLIIKREEDKDRALRVLQKAEAACLISNSVKSKITMIPVVEVVADLMV
jgi:peroxiredoxin-like protein